MAAHELVEPLTVTVRRFEELLHIGHTKAYELINAGEVQTVKLGTRRLVIYASVRDYLLRLASMTGKAA